MKHTYTKHTNTGVRSLSFVLATCALAPSSSATTTLETIVSQQSVPLASRATHVRQPQPGEFNVLLVVLDDMGTDKLGMYGVDAGPPVHCGSPQISAIPTPNLDALRADGVLFTRCYSNPTCSPTRSALLTGRYGMRTGMGQQVNVTDSPGYTLPGSEMTVAEIIRDLNPFAYRRGAFGKWHVADYTTGACHPADSGFERFDGSRGNVTNHFEWEKVTSLGGTVAGCALSSAADVPAFPGFAPSTDSWDASVTRADTVAWINGLGDSERFFAYVNFQPPHAPFQVPPFSTLSAYTAGRLSFLGYEAADKALPGQPDEERLIYHANIEGVDHEIGRLMSDMTPAVLARTIIVIVGDNGTVGSMINDPSLSTHGKRSLYELGTRVPLIVKGPFTPAGGTCRSLVDTVDFWRTMAELTGVLSTDIDVSLGATVSDSRSFLKGISRPLLPLSRAYSYSESFPNGAPPPANISYLRGITNGEYRYMRIWSDAGVMSERLFHLPSDACETLNLMMPPHVLSPGETAALGALQTAMDAL